MSRVYAIDEETGERFLRHLACDGLGCEATIKPHPDINKSGWMKQVQTYHNGRTELEWDYCPDCWARLP